MNNQYRKLRGIYVDWQGALATEEQYNAQFEDAPVEDVSIKDVQIEDSEIPHKDRLLEANYTSLRQLPGSKEELADSVPGVGDKAAQDISDWIENEFGVGLS